MELLKDKGVARRWGMRQKKALIRPHPGNYAKKLLEIYACYAQKLKNVGVRIAGSQSACPGADQRLFIF